MAEKLDPNTANNLIEQVAAKALGEAPQDAPPPVEAKIEATVTEQAVEAGSPETEGDLQAKSAILYEIEMSDGTKRNMSPQQIASTAERYADLNYKNAQNKNLNKVVEYAIKNGVVGSADEAALKIAQMIKAGQSNPTMGEENSKQNQNVAQKEERKSADALSEWEEQNAVSLPPGFRDMISMNQSTQQQIGQIAKLLQTFMSQTANMSKVATNEADEATMRQAQTAAQMAEMNLNRMGTEKGIADADAEEFINFAYENGYTDADFIDAELVNRLGDQFIALKRMPEYEGMKKRIAARTAWTGNMGPTPAGEGGVAPEDNPEDATLNRLAERAPGRRMG